MNTLQRMGDSYLRFLVFVIGLLAILEGSRMLGGESPWHFLPTAIAAIVAIVCGVVLFAVAAGRR